MEASTNTEEDPASSDSLSSQKAICFSYCWCQNYYSNHRKIEERFQYVEQ